ncbi:Ankyrin repeat domain-containing protein [Lachnellula arida]|uniref:Ankyrin repeat domain-containing protein n=1 Tax=Lachnellula arida TaxID=1316785 RepID=A0A8T9B9E8_9HELO|nr:Ankyrin repeat domain-containing protein [Lachnellula arida]
MELVSVGSDSRPQRKIESTLLLDAGRDGNEELACSLLNEGGANIRETNGDGQTALHLAVLNSHESVLRLLIEKGADIEASTKDGSKPLYIAAKSGNLSLVEALLSFGAEVKSFNVKTQTTAFYQAIENDHEKVARILLEHGQDIDFKVLKGRTALYSAVVRRKLALVEFLLRQGANKKPLEEEGILERLANGDDTDQEILKILQKALLVQGPSIDSSNKKGSESRFTHVPSLPATEDQFNRLKACRGFEATIVDFFVGGCEERVPLSASVFDILYGIGPEAIMGKDKDPKILGTRPSFRWYHLPANNALVSRLVAERKSGAAMLDDDLKSSLGLSNASGRQYQASTAHSSFMRPLCRAVKIPFLHFETHDAYEEMISIISEVKYEIENGRDLPPTSTEEAKRVRKSRLSRRTRAAFPEFEDGYMPVIQNAKRKKLIHFKDAVGRKFSFPFDMVATWAGMKELITQCFWHVNDRPRVQDGHYDLIGPNGEIILPQVWERIIEPDWTISMRWCWPMPEPKPALYHHPGIHPGMSGLGIPRPERRGHTGPGARPPPPPLGIPFGAAGSAPQPPSGSHSHPPDREPVIVIKPSTHKKKAAKPSAFRWFAGSSKPPGPPLGAPPPPENIGDQDAGQEARSSPIPSQGNSNGPKSKGKGPDRTDTQQSGPSEHKWMSKDHPDKDLIMGYLFPTKPGETPPLQPRRTLDQYFYTHLESTSQRDADQVVYRYTRRTTSEAKIFMVDQLWLWILNGVISCFPQRWQSELQDELRPEEKAHDTKLDEPPSVPKQDPLPDNRTAGVPESSGLPTTSALQRPSSVPQPQIHRPGPPSPPPGWHGRTGGPPYIANLPQGKKKKKKPSSIPRWIGGRSVRSSGKKSDVRERMIEPAESPVKNSDQDVEGGESPIKTEQPPATMRDSLSSAMGLPAPPPPVLPHLAPSLPPDHEIPLHFQDNTPTYAAEQAKQPSREDTRSIKSTSSSTAKPKAFRAIREDPLDVHQTILRYLKLSARAPITTIYELANLIINSCANVFDQYSVPDAFQFLDFFERSIGNIIDKEAQCLQEFTDSLKQENVILDITKETALLVEIKDISGELDILQIVLDDQKKTIEDMAHLTRELTKGTTTVTSKDENLSLEHNRVLDSHIYRIQKMKKMTEVSYKGIQHLLDLKQKQANFSEALSARKQAENTFHQADLARQQGERSLEQAQLAAEQTKLTTEQVQELNKQTKLAREQADETVRQGEETARQGKTILMFTVVTIIFVS